MQAARHYRLIFPPGAVSAIHKELSQRARARVLCAMQREAARRLSALYTAQEERREQSERQRAAETQNALASSAQRRLQAAREEHCEVLFLLLVLWASGREAGNAHSTTAARQPRLVARLRAEGADAATATAQRALADVLPSLRRYESTAHRCSAQHCALLSLYPGSEFVSPLEPHTTLRSNGSVYLCPTTGHVHFCEATRCEERSCDGAERTCLLTGRVLGKRLQQPASEAGPPPSATAAATTTTATAAGGRSGKTRGARTASKVARPLRELAEGDKVRLARDRALQRKNVQSARDAGLPGIVLHSTRGSALARALRETCAAEEQKKTALGEDYDESRAHALLHSELPLNCDHSVTDFPAAVLLERCRCTLYGVTYTMHADGMVCHFTTTPPCDSAGVDHKRALYAAVHCARPYAWPSTRPVDAAAAPMVGGRGRRRTGGRRAGGEKTENVSTLVSLLLSPPNGAQLQRARHDTLVAHMTTAMLGHDGARCLHEVLADSGTLPRELQAKVAAYVGYACASHEPNERAVRYFSGAVAALSAQLERFKSLCAGDGAGSAAGSSNSGNSSAPPVGLAHTTVQWTVALMYMMQEGFDVQLRHYADGRAVLHPASEPHRLAVVHGDGLVGVAYEECNHDGKTADRKLYVDDSGAVYSVLLLTLIPAHRWLAHKLVSPEQIADICPQRGAGAGGRRLARGTRVAPAEPVAQQQQQQHSARDAQQQSLVSLIGVSHGPTSRAVAVASSRVDTQSSQPPFMRHKTCNTTRSIEQRYKNVLSMSSTVADMQKYAFERVYEAAAPDACFDAEELTAV